MITKLLDIVQGAKELRLSESNVRRLIRLGHLPVVRLGGRVLLTETDIENFIQKAKKPETTNGESG